MIEINSLEQTEIAPFVEFNETRLSKDNLIIVESEKVVNKLLKSTNKVLKIWATKDFFTNNIIDKEIECLVSPKNLLSKIRGFNKHHGVFALAERPKFKSLEQMDDKILVLNGLTSPENVGSIMRSAAAFNINSIIIDDKTVSPYTNRCIRVSMGNIFSINIHKTNRLSTTLKKLEDDNYTTIATANTEESISIKDCNFNQKVAVIIGSEGHGIDQELIRNCDLRVKIPINSDVAHLNAGHASAVFLSYMSNI